MVLLGIAVGALLLIGVIEYICQHHDQQKKDRRK